MFRPDMQAHRSENKCGLVEKFHGWIGYNCLAPGGEGRRSVLKIYYISIYVKVRAEFVDKIRLNSFWVINVQFFFLFFFMKINVQFYSLLPWELLMCLVYIDLQVGSWMIFNNKVLIEQREISSFISLLERICDKLYLFYRHFSKGGCSHPIQCIFLLSWNT